MPVYIYRHADYKYRCRDMCILVINLCCIAMLYRTVFSACHILTAKNGLIGLQISRSLKLGKSSAVLVKEGNIRLRKLTYKVN